MQKNTFIINKYLKDLELLVNIDSGSKNISGIEKVASFFTNKFTQIGWSVKKHEFNKMAGPCLEITNNNKETYDFLLIGHMDTVFPDETTKKRPFTIDGARAYGPGVIDMKSGLLSIYYSLCSINTELQRKDISICVIINGDEEIGSKNSFKIIECAAKKSKIALIFEPARANGALVLQRKGLAAYDLEFKGIAAHAGVEPEKGASAVVEMARWITELDKLNNYEIGTSINTGVISGGIARNVIPDSSFAQVDLRFKCENERFKVEKKMEEMSKNPSKYGTIGSYIMKGMRPPMNANDKTMEIYNRLDNIGQSLGIDMSWTQTGGGSDGNYTAALGIPTIDGMGPVGGGSHGDSEYLEIDTVEPRCELLKKFITDTSSDLI